MSDYIKATNFTPKDSLPSGDPNKIIKGFDFDVEFDAIETAIGTKANKVATLDVGKLLIVSNTGDLEASTTDITQLLADARDRSTHTGTQPVATITGLGSLALLNQVPNLSIGNSQLANASITTNKFPVPVSGSTFQQRYLGDASGVPEFTAALSGSVSMRLVTPLSVQTVIVTNVESGAVVLNGTGSVGGGGTFFYPFSIVRGQTYSVSAGGSDTVAIFTGNDVGIPAVV